MTATMLLVSVATLGVTYGWQPIDDDGGLEYIIQIERPLLDALRDGEELTSHIPPDVAQGIRRYRIVVGDRELPKIGRTPPRDQPRETSASSGKPSWGSQETSLADDSVIPDETETSEMAANASANPPKLGGRYSENEVTSPQTIDGDDPVGPSSMGAPDSLGPERTATTLPDVWGKHYADEADPNENNPDEHLQDEDTTDVHNPLHDESAAGDLEEQGLIGYGSENPHDSHNDPAREPGKIADAAAASAPIDFSPREILIPTSSGGMTFGVGEASSQARPWLPLILTLLGLFASLGANMYLSWITWDTRNRYRSLLQETS